MYSAPRNPFRYGDLALDEAFADREEEVRELTADMRNGQNVLVYAPRRYGKSSLVFRAASKAIEMDTLVAYCDLMRTSTKEQFAAALAKSIYENLATRSDQAVEKAVRLFSGLRVKPVTELDPDTGSLRFTFDAARRKRSGDIDDTIERLLELPQQIAGERRRPVVLILDEFQEVVRLDKNFPNMMRAIFQMQPEVSHVYLGSKRHVIDEIFSNKNEPFWRSSKRLEIGPIPPDKFRSFIKKRFSDTDKDITDEALGRVLQVTNGHPYGTQELCYHVWEIVPTGHSAFPDDVESAIAQVLRGEHNHFSRLWEDATEHQRLLMLALAAEPSGIYSIEWQSRHGLPANTFIQRAATTLVREEVIGKDATSGSYMIIEPFLAEWLNREQADAPVTVALRQQQQQDAEHIP